MELLVTLSAVRTSVSGNRRTVTVMWIATFSTTAVGISMMSVHLVRLKYICVHYY